MGWLRTTALLVALVALSGCNLFGSTVYVKPKRNAIPLVPRPKIHNSPTTVEQLKQDRSVLKRALVAWEKVAISRNKEIRVYNEENGYATDPNSTKIVVKDYNAPGQ